MSGYCYAYVTRGYCQPRCHLSHKKEDAPLCLPWTKGLCIGATGNNCRKRHFYKEGDRASIQPVRAAQVSSETAEFSSPLVVKVRKEVAKERKEEFDLETGKRRSWVEERFFDVLDLTGMKGET